MYKICIPNIIIKLINKNQSNRYLQTICNTERDDTYPEQVRTDTERSTVLI